jgi:phosphoglycolate phosphatase/pyrophosphatase PpaX
MSQNLFRPKAAIFDFDGTLVDTFALIATSYAAACREYLGRDLTEQEVIARFGATELNMLRKDIPPPLIDRAIEIFQRCYRENHAKLVRVFDGIPQMLADLRAKNIPLGVMTGKGRDTADVTISKLGWGQMFQSVITGDECPNPKPAPDGVLMVAQELGVPPPDCIFVGDAPADIQAGKAAGMKTVWASWHPVYRKQIEKLGPDFVAGSPKDVASLFLTPP